jgi:hypothetical protein
MWIIRAFNRHDDELVEEHQLPAPEHEPPGAQQRALAQLLGFMPTAFGDNPLTDDQVRRLHYEPSPDREFFLEWDADPHRSSAARWAAAHGLAAR